MPKVRLEPRGLELAVAAGETILEAALRQGYGFPHSCDNGVCEICSSRLLEGDCQIRNRAQQVAAGDSQAQNLLICLAEPRHDCRLEIHNILAPGELPVRRLACQVQSIEVLAADVYRVRLLAPAGKKLEFHAGQYLQLLIPGLEAAYFSIANAPGSRELELHVEAQPERDNASEVIRYLREHATVKVALPFGKACLPGDLPVPMILIAAGTGFAQVKSILEQLLAFGHREPVHLYWGTRVLKEMYLKDMAEEWQRQHDNLVFVPIAADNADNEWQGHHVELCEAVAAGQHDFRRCQVFVSGSPTMVYTILDRLVELGLNPVNFHSDVLEYAPRDAQAE